MLCVASQLRYTILISSSPYCSHTGFTQFMKTFKFLEYFLGTVSFEVEKLLILICSHRLISASTCFLLKDVFGLNIMEFLSRVSSIYLEFQV